METVIEKILLSLLKMLVTPTVVQMAKKHLIEFLQEKAAETSNAIDDEVVQLVAEAIGYVA